MHILTFCLERHNARRVQVNSRPAAEGGRHGSTTSPDFVESPVVQRLNISDRIISPLTAALSSRNVRAILSFRAWGLAFVLNPCPRAELRTLSALRCLSVSVHRTHEPAVALRDRLSSIGP